MTLNSDIESQVAADNAKKPWHKTTTGIVTLSLAGAAILTLCIVLPLTLKGPDLPPAAPELAVPETGAAPLGTEPVPELPYLTRESPDAFAARLAALPEEERAAAYPERATTTDSYSVRFEDGFEDLYLVQAAPGQDVAFALTIADGSFYPRADPADQDWDGPKHTNYDAYSGTMTLVFSGDKFALAGSEGWVDTHTAVYCRFASTNAAYMAKINVRGGGSVSIDASVTAYNAELQSAPVHEAHDLPEPAVTREEPAVYLTSESPNVFAARLAGLASEEQRAAAHPEPITEDATAEDSYTNTTDDIETLYLVQAVPGQDVAFALTIAGGSFSPRADLADQDGDGPTPTVYDAYPGTMTFVFSGDKFTLAGSKGTVDTFTYAHERFASTNAAAYMARIYMRTGGSVSIDTSVTA